MQLGIAYNATTKEVEVVGAGGSKSTGANWEDLGSFDHIGQTGDPLNWSGNHVIYQHVQNILYVQKGVEDMMYHTITIKGDVDEGDIAVESVTVNPETASISLAATETIQLTAIVLPSIASDQTVTWDSSTPATATVGADGLVTPVAEGTTIVTATTTDGGFTDTCEVTVVA